MITNGLPPIHPGEMLQEILEDLHVNETDFADAIGVSSTQVTNILKGTHPITAELALRLSRAFKQTPQYWLNLQTGYDLKIAQTEWKDSIANVREIANIS